MRQFIENAEKQGYEIGRSMVIIDSAETVARTMNVSLKEALRLLEKTEQDYIDAEKLLEAEGITREELKYKMSRMFSNSKKQEDVITTDDCNNNATGM